MRKLFLWVVLALLVCSAGIASAFDAAPSDAFTGFGIQKVYSTDNPVIIRADGEPYYSDVKTLQCIGLNLAARVKDGYTGNYPSGTLTLMGSGIRYALAPLDLEDTLCTYYVPGINLSSLAGEKIMWNLYTSPDVTAGSAVIPDTAKLTLPVAKNEIVPCIKLSRSDNNASVISRADLFFVRSGDWSKAVSPGVSAVRVYVNTSSESGASAYATFTNFNKPVRNSFSLNIYESGLDSLAVEYEKDGAKYIWNFKLSHGAYSAIEWGKLSLDAQPLTLKAGETAKIDVKIPARYNLAEYFADTSKTQFLTIGNSSVLSLKDDSVSFSQGSSSWSGLTFSETKSTLSFTLTAKQQGRTTLCIDIPGLGREYYREVRVTDRQGRLTLPDSNPSGMYLKAEHYEIYSHMLNGRPYYPSAEFGNMTFSLGVSSDNPPSSGFMGLTSGTRSEVHPVYIDWDEDSTKYAVSSAGACWDTADSSSNTEYPSLSITAEDIDNASVWWEFPENSSMNVASASLRAVISGDYLISSNPLQDFVPYFEMEHDPQNIDHINSFSVYFVNPDSMARVTPDITEANVGYWYDWDTYRSEALPKEGKSLPISYYSSASGNFDGEYHDTIYITYTYNGVAYEWEFTLMDNDFYGYIADFAMSMNTPKTVNVNVNASSDLEAVDFIIWDKDFLSADPVSFAPADEISFDLAGLKEGRAKASLVFTRNDYSSYDKYVQSGVIIQIVSSDSEAQAVNTGSADLRPDFIVPGSYASIAEGVPNYYYSDDSEALYLNLNRIGYVPSEYIYSSNILSIQNGTLHIYSDDEEIDTKAMYPSVIGWYYDDKGAEYAVLSYGSYFLPEGATRIEWTASSEVITSGSADISGLSVRSTASQLQTYKPFIKLNREGLNISTLEYYFADSMDNKMPVPDGVDNVSVYVSAITGDIVNEDDSGVMTLNMPEIYIGGIAFMFRDNGINYTWEFAPVDNPYYREADDVMTWNVSSPDIPLIMRIGDTRELTLTAQNLASPSAVVGNSAIVSLETLSSTGSSVNVRLTALSAGMTSITLTDGENMSWPREIWVADSSGKVPHLTDDIDALAESLSSGESGDLSDSGSTSGGDTGDDDNRPDFTTGDPEAVLDGLSVYPRFAVPTDPSGDADDLEWQKVYSGNLPYGVFMFEDDADILASRDVMSVFTELSMDLISRYPAQLLAVVLPEVQVKASGIYTFRIPIENVILPGTKIFMHTYMQESYSSETEGGSRTYSHEDAVIPDGISVESSGDMYTLTNSYSVYISTDKGDDGLAALIISSSDISLPEYLKYSVRSIDSAGNVLALRITANEKYYDLDQFTEGHVSIPYTNAGKKSALEWDVIFPADDDGMNYYTDDGTAIDCISGDEYVNVAVYLSAGRYTPVITAKAISNDVRLIAGLPVIPDNDPISFDVNPDSGAVKPDSGDVKPDSGDVKPDSGDVKPDSGDVKPDSDDKPSPTPGTDSDDKPSPTPGTDSDDKPSPTPGSDPNSGNDREDTSGGSTPGGNTEPDNEDNTGGGSEQQESGNTMFPVAPTKPGVDVEDDSLIQRIINTIRSLSSRVLGSSEVLELPDSAVGAERSELTYDELAAIPSTETPVVILPLMRVNKAAVYVFGVNISSLRAGAPIFLYMMPEYVASGSEFRASASDYDAYMFLDDNGTQTDILPGNNHVNVAVYMEPDVIYAPVITTTASSSNPGGSTPGGNTPGGDTNTPGGDTPGGSTPGGNPTSSDNTGGNPTTPDNAGSSGGGGGCSTGESFAMLLLAVLGFIQRRK